jgi:hypothetical protein
VELVTITLLDTAHGDVPVPDALVNVYDSTGAVFVTSQRTDVSGEASFTLAADTYVIRPYKPGLVASEESLVVADTGGLTPQAFDVGVENTVVSPPASPTLCRLYADFVTQGGEPLEQFKLQVENLFSPASLGVMGGSDVHETNASGHVEFDLVRGAHVRVAFLTTPLTRDFVVPDVPVADLLTVFGDASDAFQIVKRT